jgi:hypothetical protein
VVTLLGPATAGGDPFDRRIVELVALEPRVDDPDGGIRIAPWRIGPAVRRQRRILHVDTSEMLVGGRCSHTGG